MIAFGHTAIGALTGLAVYQVIGPDHPELALGVTFVSSIGLHYLTDTIPHGHLFPHREYQQKVKYAIIFDLLGSIILFGSLAWIKFGLSLEFWLILIGIIGCQLPDVLDGLIYTQKLPATGVIRYELLFHQATHWHGKLDQALLWGKRDIWQVMTIIISLWLILTH